AGEEPGCDPTLRGIERTDLGAGAWIDYLPRWVRGHDTLLEILWTTTRWEGHRRQMYDHIVDVPRLMASLPEDGPGHPLVDEMAAILSARCRRPLLSPRACRAPAPAPPPARPPGRPGRLRFPRPPPGPRPPRRHRRHHRPRRASPLPAAPERRRPLARLRRGGRRSPRHGRDLPEHVGAREHAGGARRDAPPPST